MAPVASPTPIICTTMLGKTPLSFSGSTMVRPSSTALRTFIKDCSSTALPEVRAVIASPSRMGTPEVIRVPSVRVKRATAILRNSMPTTGRFSIKRSVASKNAGFLRPCAIPYPMATRPMTKKMP